MSETHRQVEAAPENRVERYMENGTAGHRIENHEAASEASPVQAPVAREMAPAPAVPPAPAPEETSSEQKKSGCGCGCSGNKTVSPVYALGQIDFDYGSEARRDSFVQQGVRNPGNPRELLDHLDKNPWAAASVIWTLVQETTPIYAVRPAGPYAHEGFDRLRNFLRGQLDQGVSQISLPGIEAGSVTLLNGQEVSVIIPEIRGMYSWSTPALVEAVLGKRPENGCEDYDRQAEEVGNFLERVYYEISNLGLAPQERAVNYAATNAYQVATVYRDAIKQDLKLDKIGVERSSVCRPGSDCWDVKLSFFDPARRHEKAKEIFRFTIDVSDVVPVTVGKVRRWSAF